MKGHVGNRHQRARHWVPPIWEFVLVCIVGIALIFTTQRLARMPGDAVSQAMRAAADTMQVAMDTLATHRTEHGPAIDPGTDINRTGLIGTFYSPLTTTVGNLEAKRTTTNPNMAAMLVDLLTEAGVKAGDFIAVGASGSFPALILATISAAQTLQARVGLIVSLGSSQFGANIPEFTWLDMERILVEEGVFASQSVAASLGGDLDVARDLSGDVRSQLREKVSTFSLALIHESDLVRNVQQRMSIYRDAASGERIAAFVNIGGAWANMGVDASILTALPGVIELDDLPTEGVRGVMHAMAAEHVPVIHLLNIKELVVRYGLPWDPSPLPTPGQGSTKTARDGEQTLWPAMAYLAVVVIWLGSVALRRSLLRRRVIPIDTLGD
ncbi:MAG: poly-gamma-glutamate system protein [Candidatus Atribacteria bacterium]|nr:MAG: poly-gamma-glutamate system protein [Candidatus Atribacteria bacterium]